VSKQFKELKEKMRLEARGRVAEKAACLLRELSSQSSGVNKQKEPENGETGPEAIK
jgi:hypothetical protein